MLQNACINHQNLFLGSSGSAGHSVNISNWFIRNKIQVTIDYDSSLKKKKRMDKIFAEQYWKVSTVHFTSKGRIINFDYILEVTSFCYAYFRSYSIFLGGWGVTEEKGNHQSIFQLSLVSTSPERAKQKSWEPKTRSFL